MLNLTSASFLGKLANCENSHCEKLVQDIWKGLWRLQPWVITTKGEEISGLKNSSDKIAQNYSNNPQKCLFVSEAGRPIECFIKNYLNWYSRAPTTANHMSSKNLLVKFHLHHKFFCRKFSVRLCALTACLLHGVNSYLYLVAASNTKMRELFEAWGYQLL